MRPFALRNACLRPVHVLKYPASCLTCPTSPLHDAVQETRCLSCQASASAGGEEATTSLRAALQGETSPAYKEGAALLKEIGFDNQSEIARILDVAMNPNSLFVTYRDKKRAVNTNARTLSVEDDMRPVVTFFQERGLRSTALRNILAAHPPVLSYSVEERLIPFCEYLITIGIDEPMKVVEQRPSLLGLDVDKNLRKIVEYLQANDYSMEDIVTYLATSI